MMSKNSSFVIYDAACPAEKELWINEWKAWPNREVYAHPNYAKLYATQPDSRALCAVWHSSAGSVLFPFILNSLQTESWWNPTMPPLVDIITPYGYGGPFVWKVQDKQQLQQQFWPAFDDWAKRAHVVSEFIRFTLFSETVLSYPGETVFKLQNIVRTLDVEETSLWMDFKQKVRKNVNRAQESGVYVENDPSGSELKDFLRIYRQTLDRRNALEIYYFTEEYLKSLTEEMPGQFMFFHAKLNDVVISTELVLVSAENVYSFLGGTDDSFFHLRPNDLLKYEIINWAQANQKKRFVLGGGYSDGDGIFQYKKAFAPKGVLPFCVGTRILNLLHYEQLIKKRQVTEPSWSPDNTFFPLYRA